MNRNLVSGDLLGKPGIKFVYESGKLILTSNGVFVGVIGGNRIDYFGMLVRVCVCFRKMSR